VGSIGSSLWIAGKFLFWDVPEAVISGLLLYFDLGPDALAKRTAEQRDEDTALKLLDLEGLQAKLGQAGFKQDPREEIAANEAALYLKVARLIARGVVANYRDAQRNAAPPAQLATRNQHAKQHGCVRACFIVDDQLDDDLAVGVFRRGARYDAILRFSNAHETAKPDRKGDGRGLAIKLPTRGNDWPCQDFVLVNYPVFFLDDLPEYTRFMEIVLDRSSNLLMGLRLFFFFVPCRLRKAFIFLRIGMSRIRNPLNTTYHSMSAYGLGDHHVVRYIVSPAGEVPPGSGPETPNFLRERMAERLALKDSPDPRLPTVLDFSVQIRHDPVPEDVEKVSRPWRRPEDRTVHLARIEIPHQKFDAADELCNCENLRFNPWNGLPEHRPLGGMNRIRLLVYIASSAMRQRLNMVDRK
jgi:hypothetical protein